MYYKATKSRGNFLNRSQLGGQHVASSYLCRWKPSSITYILAVAGWPSLAKQGPFNMIRTDYGVVCTSKEPGPIITPAFQHDSRSSSSLPSNVERKREKTEPRRLLMDGFIIHSGLSCTVSGGDGAQLPALWFVLKID